MSVEKHRVIYIAALHVHASIHIFGGPTIPISNMFMVPKMIESLKFGCTRLHIAQ